MRQGRDKRETGERLERDWSGGVGVNTWRDRGWVENMESNRDVGQRETVRGRKYTDEDTKGKHMEF